MVRILGASSAAAAALIYRLRLRRGAERDIARAQAWYEAKLTGLGGEFCDEVGRALDRVAEAPFAYAKQYREVRRVPLRRFPFLLGYRIVGHNVQVLAVTDGRQEPAKTEEMFQ